MNTRICKYCTRELSISEFHKHSSYKFGVMPYCSDCRAARTKVRRKERGEEYKSYARKQALNYRTKHPEFTFYSNAKARARKENLPFTITRADIVIPERCPVFDIPLIRSSRLTDNSPTLDKIIPELGYVPGNVAVISHKANKLKSNGLLDDFIKLISWLGSLKSNEIANIHN